MKRQDRRFEESEPMTLLRVLDDPTAAAPARAEPLLTRSQVARMLGVSPTTVTRWAREGRLACRTTLGGHHRFSRALIEEVRARMSAGRG